MRELLDSRHKTDGERIQKDHCADIRLSILTVGDIRKIVIVVCSPSYLKPIRVKMHYKPLVSSCPPNSHALVLQQLGTSIALLLSDCSITRCGTFSDTP
jgi:hypothetical protein